MHWPKQLIRRSVFVGILARAAALSAQVTDVTPSMTLVQAREVARAHSPVLVVAEADVGAVQADLVTARTVAFNPEVELESASRTGTDTRSRDRGYGINQEVEIAGQRGKRVAVAEQTVAAAEARRDRRRAEVDAAVERAFGAAVVGRELVAVATLDVDLASKLRDFEEQRLSAGAGTPTDLNFARAAEARAKSRLEEARAAESTARAELAEVIGISPALAPSAAGPFPAMRGDLPPLDALVAQALPRRGDLQALRREVDQAQQTIALERALRVPNLRLGVFDRREESLRIRGASVALAVPLFNRSQGAVARAESASARARAELELAELSARREIASAYAQVTSSAASVKALEQGLVGGLEESLSMLEQSFTAGKIGSRDLLLFRRELVEARREHVEAQGRLATATADLELATAGAISPVDQETPHAP